MAGGRAKRQKADCRADTRGGPWAGIPKVLIDSVAYRHLSVHARAVLIELVARMNGYNNGQIGMSQREMVSALQCSARAVVAATAELMDHGIIDVTVEGTWKTRQARLYRLTFVNTKGAPATNEYLRWTPTLKKSRATTVVAEGPQSASAVVTDASSAASDVVADAPLDSRKSANSANRPASAVVALICKPYPARETGAPPGQQEHLIDPPIAAGLRCSFVTKSECERCGRDVPPGGRGSHVKRFCSETCRKSAERARARERQSRHQELKQIGAGR